MTTLDERIEAARKLDGYTPGPWDASGLTVYDTCMDGVASCHTGADARLIAAAPDLHRLALDLAAERERLLTALRLHKAWADSERTGPDYGGQSRDTHPDGERIWRQWWDNQLDLCDRAQTATDAALASETRA